MASTNALRSSVIQSVAVGAVAVVIDFLSQLVVA
jgi:hypothetical protein